MASDADSVKYRRLNIGEVIKAGDEYQSEETKIWTRVPEIIVGKVIDEDHLPLRRLCLCGAQPSQRCDLPEAVAELRERVARVEAAVTPKSVSVSNAEGPENKGDTMPAEGLRTERVTLEVTQKTDSYVPPSKFDWNAMLRSAATGRLFPGESVRVVEDATIGSGDVFADVGCGSFADEVVRLTAERNKARAECEQLRAAIATVVVAICDAGEEVKK